MGAGACPMTDEIAVAIRCRPMWLVESLDHVPRMAAQRLSRLIRVEYRIDKGRWQLIASGYDLIDWDDDDDHGDPIRLALTGRSFGLVFGKVMQMHPEADARLVNDILRQVRVPSR